MEGDPTVLHMQCGKSLLTDAFKVLESGKLVARQLKYMQDLPRVVDNDPSYKPTITDASYFENESNLVQLLKINALLRLKGCRELYTSQGASMLTDWQKLNQVVQVDIIKMSEAAAYYITAKYFFKMINSYDATVCKNIKKHLRTALRIYSIYSLVRIGGALLLNEYLTPDQMNMMNEVLYKEYANFRPQMLNLAEGFVMNDAALFSTIGSEDGNIYEKMLKVAKSSRLNDKDTFDGFEEYL
eukprot:CAMPEP_0170547616 /NCGR_PEP_ID=MMETSP0211-20121228/6013_1 /TAXON_ID=311385 /ORGANISM="Pseudokeronopsis sp., Strain OXSARD2" /LENGTH=241 /DNA_ID=CAMNT_0010852761 /DNA_START=1222 /DNA_END=1947 /DNA_ORIENTATION=-